MRQASLRGWCQGAPTVRTNDHPFTPEQEAALAVPAEPSNVLLLTAAPGSGKTFLAATRTANLYREGKRVLFLGAVNATRHAVTKAVVARTGMSAADLETVNKTFASFALKASPPVPPGPDLDDSVRDLYHDLPRALAGIVDVGPDTTPCRISEFHTAVRRCVAKWRSQTQFSVRAPPPLITKPYVRSRFLQCGGSPDTVEAYVAHAEKVLAPLNGRPLPDTEEPQLVCCGIPIIVAAAAWWILVHRWELAVGQAMGAHGVWAELRVRWGTGGPLVTKPFGTLHEIVVDEGSDLDPTHLGIALRAADVLKAHLVILGDPNQHIYGFSGAGDVLTSSVWDGMGMTPRRLTLSCSFRLPQSVVDFVNGLLPEDWRRLVCGSGRPGSVVLVAEGRHVTPATVLRRLWATQHPRPASTAIIHRTNAAAATTALQLQDMPFIVSKQFADAFKAAEEALHADGHHGLVMDTSLDTDPDTDTDKPRVTGMMQAMRAMGLARAPCGMRECPKGDRAFHNPVYVQTAHGSKGSEVHTTIVAPDLLDGLRPGGLTRLQFVALTRCTDVLILVTGTPRDVVDESVQLALSRACAAHS
jgi:hypothetical protein